MVRAESRSGHSCLLCPSSVALQQLFGRRRKGVAVHALNGSPEKGAFSPTPRSAPDDGRGRVEIAYDGGQAAVRSKLAAAAAAAAVLPGGDEGRVGIASRSTCDLELAFCVEQQPGGNASSAAAQPSGGREKAAELSSVGLEDADCSAAAGSPFVHTAGESLRLNGTTGAGAAMTDPGRRHSTSSEAASDRGPPRGKIDVEAPKIGPGADGRPPRPKRHRDHVQRQPPQKGSGNPAYRRKSSGSSPTTRPAVPASGRLAIAPRLSLDFPPGSRAPSPPLLPSPTEKRRSGSSDRRRSRSGGKRTVIKSADMAEDLQQEALQCVDQAIRDFEFDTDIAAHIKKEFDEKHGAKWHCVVGKHFGSYVTHEASKFIYLSQGQMAVLLFKAG